MIVLALLCGIWIAEFSGINAMQECELYADTSDAPIVCVYWSEG